MDKAVAKMGGDVESKLIITQPAPEQSLTPHVDSRRAIQKALKTAVIWNSLLLSGVFESTSEIAERYNLSQRYISQILKLTYISPEIIKKILSGDIPYCLTLGKFKQNIPICWNAQKDLYFWFINLKKFKADTQMEILRVG